MTNIVVIGGGFAGVRLVKQLRHRNDVSVTIIDKFNFHQFQPLFYQVAAARLEPSSISFPLRKIFQGKKNIRVRVAEVEAIDLTQQQVITHEQAYPYDVLVVATGCRSNYFGNAQIEQHAFPMKTTPDALAIRNRLLTNFEKTIYATGQPLQALLNIVIVGGGPTGVEMAGALAEMKKNVLPKDYPDRDFSALQVHLVEGGNAVLGAMSEASKQKAQQYLKELGVTLWLNTTVQDYDGHKVMMSNGQTLYSNNLIWAAGIMGNVPKGIPDHALTRGNRIRVDEYNKVQGLDNLYAIGDVCYMETQEWPKGHPQLANVANNQAAHLGKNLKAMLQGKNMKPFTYKNPGTMATIGKRKAVVDLPGFSFQGRMAWFTWMFLHLMLILSVNKKLLIFINWAYSYFTNDTTLRLILKPTAKEQEVFVEP